jgi:hypothetical protein
MQKINRKINCFYDLNYFIIITCCIISMIKAADDPRRRFYEIDYGLNIKGSCKNSSCISASYQMQDHIFVKKGYGIFDMGLINNKNVCPACQTPMAPDSFKNIGYCHARITI